MPLFYLLAYCACIFSSNAPFVVPLSFLLLSQLYFLVSSVNKALFENPLPT